MQTTLAPRTMTLRADNRSVRTATGKAWYVAVAVAGQPDRLKVVKRSNNPDTIRAELRRLYRAEVKGVCVFDRHGKLWA